MSIATRLKLTTVIAAALAMFTLAGCHSKTSGEGTGGAAAPLTTVAQATSAAAGDCPTSNTVSFAKTKFVAHLGLAAGTFHRYIYKPYKAGSFASGTSGRTLSLVKAGASALFAEHEARLAIEDVKASPALCNALVAPLSDLADKLHGLKTQLTGGNLSALEGANTALAGITSTSSAHGAPITETTDPAAAPAS